LGACLVRRRGPSRVEPRRAIGAVDRSKLKERPVPREIGREDVKRMVAAGAQLVEVLPANEYAEDHLPGALNLPLRKLELEARETLDPSRPVIVYCWDSG